MIAKSLIKFGSGDEAMDESERRNERERFREISAPFKRLCRTEDINIDSIQLENGGQ